MAEDTGTNADPSMEEILASIRKIISDDAPVETESESAAPAPAPAPQVAAAAAPSPVSKPNPIEEDIVELTQMVQEDGSVVDLKEMEAEPASPVMAPPVVARPAPAPAPAPSAIAPSALESLVSDPVASTAASALSSLASTLEIERLAHMPASTTYLGNGSRTLEDMVIELMRPLLKGWLDQNLPTIVERLVQKEIERISRRS